MLSSTVLSVAGKRLSHVMQSPLDSSYVLLFCVSADLFSCPFAFFFCDPVCAFWKGERPLLKLFETVRCAHCERRVMKAVCGLSRGSVLKFKVLKLFTNCSILSSTQCLWMQLATFIFFILQKGNFSSHQCVSQVSEILLREYIFLSWISHCWPLFRIWYHWPHKQDSAL